MAGYTTPYGEDIRSLTQKFNKRYVEYYDDMESIPFSFQGLSSTSLSKNPTTYFSGAVMSRGTYSGEKVAPRDITQREADKEAEAQVNPPAESVPEGGRIGYSGGNILLNRAIKAVEKAEEKKAKKGRGRPRKLLGKIEGGMDGNPYQTAKDASSGRILEIRGRTVRPSTDAELGARAYATSRGLTVPASGTASRKYEAREEAEARKASVKPEKKFTEATIEARFQVAKDDLVKWLEAGKERLKDTPQETKRMVIETKLKKGEKELEDFRNFVRGRERARETGTLKPVFSREAWTDNINEMINKKWTGLGRPRKMLGKTQDIDKNPDVRLDDMTVPAVEGGKKRGRPKKEKVGKIDPKIEKLLGGELIMKAQKGSSMSGGKRKASDKMKKRAELVKKIMKERGVKLAEASKIIKAENLSY